MPAGIAHAPGGIPLQGLIFKLGLGEPEDKVVPVPFVSVLLHAFPDAYRQILLVVVVEHIVAGQLGGIEVDVASGLIGVAGVQKSGDDLNILVNAAGGGLDGVRALDIELPAVVKEGVGVIPGDLHDGLVLPAGALEHLVLAGVGVGAQVAHIGDVHYPVHTVSGVAEVFLQDVLHDIAAEIADMGEMIHRGAAGIHFHMAGRVGFQLFFLMRGGIVEIHIRRSFPFLLLLILFPAERCGGSWRSSDPEWGS